MRGAFVIGATMVRFEDSQPSPYGILFVGGMWKLGAVFTPLAVLGVFTYAYGCTETRMTPEATKLKAYFDRLDEREQYAWLEPVLDRLRRPWEALQRLAGRPMVRYPAAAGFLWLAYAVGQERPTPWAGVVALCGIAIWLARELFGWLVGTAVVVGVFYGLFAGIAALPVSAAIVIGALIIASALKR